MKSWQETSRILDRAAGLAQTGRQAAVATVVRIEGSAYRQPGAKMLVEDDGVSTGGVSGGCLEADVREVGRAVIGSGRPELRHYQTGPDEQTVWGLGLGCNGSIDVFIQPATTQAALEAAERVRELLRGESPFAVSTIISGQGALGRSLAVVDAGLVAGSTGDSAGDRALTSRAQALLERGESQLDDLGAIQVFTEVMIPPPHLLICGAGDDARPLAAYATEAGFRVTVLDHRPAYLSADRFPEGTRLHGGRSEDGFGPLPVGTSTYAVVMMHSLVRDREWVGHLMGSEAAYIGVLGPRARTEDILQQLGATGSERVFAPVGLDVGAEGAEQIALSIVAELLTVRAGRDPRHLRDKEGAIHAG